MIYEHIHNYDLFANPCDFSFCNVFLELAHHQKIENLGHSPNKSLHFQDKNKISIKGVTKDMSKKRKKKTNYHV
jgi:hypothetical protein